LRLGGEKVVTTQIEIRSENIKYASTDGTQIDAYISRPAAPGRYPGVVVTMEAMGLLDHMRDIARRFALEGYIAVAPDLYTRQGTPADPTNLDEVIKVLFAQHDMEAVGDLEGAARYMRGLPDCTGKVGIIGFCSGGRLTLISACKTTAFNAAVDSAGGFVIEDEQTEARPQSPIDMIPTLSCPLLATFGEEDPNPPPAHAARLKEELDKHGKTYELWMYPDAGHGFFADYRDSYRPVAAQDMWHRVVVFYEKHLKS
jgi:carboxymethylenebutenolidase